MFVRQQSSIGSPHPLDGTVREAARGSSHATPSIGLEAPPLALEHAPASFISTNQTLLVDAASQSKLASRTTDETDLLRHFRYSVGMWLDIGDPECPYSIKLLQLSKSNRILETSVLALAAYQRSLADAVKQDNDYESSIRLREECELTLEQQDPSTRLLGNTLLMIGDIFSSSPLHWRTMLANYSDVFGSQQPVIGIDFGLGNALYWLHYRLGMYWYTAICLQFREHDIANSLKTSLRRYDWDSRHKYLQDQIPA